VCVGVPVANRARPEFENLVGCFMRTLALRIDVPGDPTWRELLRAVEHAALAAFAHQAITPECLPEFAHGRGPAFQTVFAFQNFPAGRLGLADLQTEPLPVHSGAAKLDLGFTVLPGALPGSGAVVQIEHHPVRFPAARVRRFFEEWIDALQQLVGAPGSLVSALPYAVAERLRLVRDFNATAADLGPPASLADLLEARAAATPDAPALFAADGAVLACAALLRRSRVIARALVAAGVKPGDLVGLHASRSPAQIAGLHGILLAGAGYLRPVRPAAPGRAGAGPRRPLRR
jgi:non-ribosomal peptide synthetase component F